MKETIFHDYIKWQTRSKSGDHLPIENEGEDLPPLSLQNSSKSSFPSKQNTLLLTLCSELALLLVARGDSDILTTRLLEEPDLTLYMEDAGMLVINGRKLLGMLLLISMCLRAMSSDFFDSVLPKPALSGVTVDFTKELMVECCSSFFGGASLLKLTTRSTILVPMTTGLSLSLLFSRDLLTAGMELPIPTFPLGGLPLEGEQDCCLGFTLGRLSTEDDLELGAPGLPREAEDGLSGNDVLKFGGVSRE